jgi:hypothetical protein
VKKASAARVDQVAAGRHHAHERLRDDPEEIFLEEEAGQEGDAHGGEAPDEPLAQLL